MWLKQSVTLTDGNVKNLEQNKINESFRMYHDSTSTTYTCSFSVHRAKNIYVYSAIALCCYDY